MSDSLMVSSVHIDNLINQNDCKYFYINELFDIESL